MWWEQHGYISVEQENFETLSIVTICKGCTFRLKNMLLWYTRWYIPINCGYNEVTLNAIYVVKLEFKSQLNETLSL